MDCIGQGRPEAPVGFRWPEESVLVEALSRTIRPVQIDAVLAATQRKKRRIALRTCMKTGSERSMGVSPMSPTGVSPVEADGNRVLHGRDGRATHGQDARATGQRRYSYTF